MENSFYENGKGEKSPDKLYVMGTPFLIEDGKVTLLPPELSFTGEDIISFNLTTREIMFTDQVIKKIGNYKCFSFYFNTETLFENVYYRSCLVDAMTNNLTLKEKFTSQQIIDAILDLENRKDLRGKYSNLYRTLNNWIKNRKYD